MPLARVLTVWLIIVLLETLHGIVRQIYLVPLLGDLHSRQLGVLIGSFLILLIVWLSYHWLGVYKLKAQLLTGAVWVGLMLIFEFSLGLAMGLSIQRLWSDYDLLHGGYMLMGMLVLLFSPVIISRLSVC